ncbi:hypothetical protein GW750_06010 [bacterium]|nr:hypothetical protein [bacterium]
MACEGDSSVMPKNSIKKYQKKYYNDIACCMSFAHCLRSETAHSKCKASAQLAAIRSACAVVHVPSKIERTIERFCSKSHHAI